MGYKHAPAEERFFRWAYPEPNSGCWLWSGTCSPGGYAQITHTSPHTGKKAKWAHRLAYEIFKGPIPEDSEIDHRCRVRCCVNPDHLEAVSKRENIHRSMGFAGLNVRKTHCKRGHEFIPENVYIHHWRNKTMRICLVCARERERAIRAGKEFI